MTQTIKEHLSAIREVSASANLTTSEDRAIYDACAAIEAKLDAPMKSEALSRCVEALRQIIEIERRDNLTDPDMTATDACRGRAFENAKHAVALADATASKSPEVDVDDFVNQVMDDEELVIEIMEDAQRMFREWDRKRGPTQTVKPQDSSDYWCVVAALKRAAMLKASGVV